MQKWQSSFFSKGKSPVWFLLIISILFFFLSRILPARMLADKLRQMKNASSRMEQALEVIRSCRQQSPAGIDRTADPYGTGLIGLEYSPLTTSLGQLEAKRTSLNPNFAGLILYLLYRAGVQPGDAVAVGASGSFPALTIALYAAASEMGVVPLVISSLGASQWGANNPDFHWIDMWTCLRKTGILSTVPVAFSLGGDRDAGLEMDESARKILVRTVKDSGIPLVTGKNLEENVRTRLDLYNKAAGSLPIRAFVNIGGSWANLGTDARILDVKPGLTAMGFTAPRENRGMMGAMAARGVPVIHCLYIRGLAEEYGLEWDPTLLPRAGKGELYRRVLTRDTTVAIVAILYFFSVVLFLIIFRGSSGHS